MFEYVLLTHLPFMHSIVVTGQDSVTVIVPKKITFCDIFLHPFVKFNGEDLGLSHHVDARYFL